MLASCQTYDRNGGREEFHNSLEIISLVYNFFYTLVSDVPIFPTRIYLVLVNSFCQCARGMDVNIYNVAILIACFNRLLAVLG